MTKIITAMNNSKVNEELTKRKECRSYRKKYSIQRRYIRIIRYKF